MYGWERKRTYKRMGMLLFMSGYLFFFSVLIDMERVMLMIQSPITMYCGEETKTVKEMLFECGMKISMPLTVFAGDKRGAGLSAVPDEEDFWSSLDAQKKMDWEENGDGRIRGQIAGQNGESSDHNNSVDRNVSANSTADVVQGMNQIVNHSETIGGKMPEEDREKMGQRGDSLSENTLQSQMKQEEITTAANEPVYHVDLTACESFSYLMEKFYVLDSTTYISADELQVGMLDGQNLSIHKMDNSDLKGQTDYSNTTNPQILIYHTHSQEGYADSVPGDDSTTVMGAGEELARILSEKYGYRVLHHTGKYDVKNRDYAYSEALPDLQQLLLENPTIEVVIDLHRDGVGEGTHLVTQINGKPTAQVMLFNGLSRTKRIGDIAYLKNENRQSNLAFSFQLQKTMMEYYPGLARKIYLKGYRYNMHFKPRSLLIELGAQTNTVEEIWNALDPLAHSIAIVLEGEE